MATRQLTTRQVVNLASDPVSGTPGEIYYNTSSNSFKYYNGTSWVAFSSGGGGDSLPSQTGNAGKYLTTNGSAASWGSITEDVQDIVGGMVSGNTESGISVTYDDTNGKLDFDVNDPTISLTGDITGSATMTNLGNVSITTTIAANSVELGTDTTGQYIASVSGTTNQVNVSGSGTESITLTLSTPQDIHSGASPTFAGATLDSVRVGITAANEIDTSSGNLIIDSAGGTVTVDDNLTVSGNLTVNGITTTVNSTTVTVDDPIITLGGDTAPSADDGKDRGIEFRYYDTQARLGFMGYNDSTGEFTLLLNATNTNEVFSGTKATLNANISGSNINAGTVSATYIDSAIARLASPTFTGTVIMPTSTSGGSSIRIPHGTAPTAPTNGDIWTTTAGVYARVNGSTVGPFGAASQEVYYQTSAPSAPSVGTIWVDSDEIPITLNSNDFALKQSPTFTGTPAAPTASVGNNTTQIATTAFVNAEISNDAVLKAGSTMTGTLVLPQATTSISSVRIPHGTAPSSPTNGDVWTTSLGMYVQVNGTTVGPLGAGGGGDTLSPFLLGGM